MSKGILYNIRRKLQVLAYNVTSPEFVSKIYFRHLLGYKLNLKNPLTFNEKLQWLKLYEWPNNELAIKCTDKYQVREYVKSKGMEKYLNKLIGVWDNANDIDFKKLPNKFVLKCNHGCRYNIVCTDLTTLNLKKIKKQLNCWLKEDFGKFNAEPHYSKIEPKIICEEFIEGDIIDYKFYCFNGKVEFVCVYSSAINCDDERIVFLNRNGTKKDCYRKDYPIFDDFKLTTQYKHLLDRSESLASDFPFVRVDWFVSGEKIYFGELTFTPAGSMVEIEPKKYDQIWGKKLDISKKFK